VHFKEGFGWSSTGPDMVVKSVDGFVVVDGKASEVHSGLKLKGSLPMPETLLVNFFRRGLRAFPNSIYCVSDPVFSPDGRSVSYIGRDGPEAAVFVDGKPGQKFTAITNLHFNPAGQAVYVAVSGKKLMAVTGNQTTDELTLPEDEDFPKSGFVDKIRMSPEGKVESYLLGRGGHEYFNFSVFSLARRKMVVGGHEEQEYNCAALSEARFSPDHRHYAYEVHRIVHGKGFEWKAFPNSFVVLDGKEGKHYDEVVPNSLRFDGDAAATYYARDGFRFLRVRENLSR
jgi:hypothetical protein